jgi:DNA (cytosine-5)-methyltransferase 1
MSRPMLLDLFCGAGGAAMGYHDAGFKVIGVDIEPQPNYPFDFIEADVMEFMPRHKPGGPFQDLFAAIHASPPCQSYSSLSGFTTTEYPALVEPVREILEESGLPYVIENVVGAPLKNPIRLCGSSFGLGVWRHRLFEMSSPPAMVPPCSHGLHPEPLDVTGTGGPSKKPRSKPGGGLSRKPRNLAQAREAMGVDWMTREELSESIPPAYTEFIGRHLLAEMAVAA